MSLTTILWDVGGVILNYDQSIADRKLAEASGRTPEEVSELIFRGSVIGREFNGGLVEAYNLGKINSKEFYEQARKFLGLNMSYDDFSKAWSEIFGINKEIYDYLKEKAKINVPQGILSSTNPLMWEEINRLTKLEEIIGKDRIICTYHADAGVKKPELALFEVVVKRLNVRKEEIIYVDDVSKYTSEAAKYGIGKTIHVDLSRPDFQRKCIEELKCLGF